MPKNFPILIEVEEIALGPVLRRLHEMTGIAKIDLQLGDGGHKPASKQLNGHGGSKANGNAFAQQVVGALINGPQSLQDIAAVVGGSTSRAHSVLTNMRVKGIVQRVGRGTYKLTAKATKAMQGDHAPIAAAAPVGVPALPAPAIRKTKSGRAPQGSGPLAVRAALNAGPVTPATLREQLASKGMSPKGVSGVVDRAKRDGLIRKTAANLYELTAKGMKLGIAEAAHG